MGARKLLTISLPPDLLKKAERMAQEENRTKSELLREALRFYVDTREERQAGGRERVRMLMNKVQGRTKGTSAREIRSLVHDAVAAARQEKPLPRS